MKYNLRKRPETVMKNISKKVKKGNCLELVINNKPQLDRKAIDIGNDQLSFHNINCHVDDDDKTSIISGENIIDDIEAMSDDIDSNGNLQNFIDYDNINGLESDGSDELCIIKKLISRHSVIDDGVDSDYLSIDSSDEDNKYCKDEMEYYTSVTTERRESIDKMEEEINNIQRKDVPLRFRIMDMPIELSTKSFVLSQLQRWQNMESSDTEYHKLGKWLETVQNIPFCKFTNNKIIGTSSITDKCNYLLTIKESLDRYVYGHNDAKLNILQYISKCISNPKATGNIMALEGPPGNGKTSLIKNGLCNATNKPFGFIGLGGLTDSSYLNGHDYTFEGSQCGKIVQLLIKYDKMDPIIFMDELDKISNSARGEELSNLLCHITDKTQNMSFDDRYLNGVTIDLSRATFIFSFNDISKINPILLDRLHIIKTYGFSIEDKITITKQYLLPEICSDTGFMIDNISIEDKTLYYIIDKYTNNEEGVRELRRTLDTIITKLNLIFTLYSDHNIVERLKHFLDLKNKYDKPCMVTKQIVDELILPNNSDFSKLMTYV